MRLSLFQVPTVIMDAHNKHVKEAVDAKMDEPVKVGLEKSGIAGTEKESSDNSEKKRDGDKSAENGNEKSTDESMEVRPILCRINYAGYPPLWCGAKQPFPKGEGLIQYGMGGQFKIYSIHT